MTAGMLRAKRGGRAAGWDSGSVHALALRFAAGRWQGRARNRHPSGQVLPVPGTGPWCHPGAHVGTPSSPQCSVPANPKRLSSFKQPYLFGWRIPSHRAGGTFVSLPCVTPACCRPPVWHWGPLSPPPIVQVRAKCPASTGRKRTGLKQQVNNRSHRLCVWLRGVIAALGREGMGSGCAGQTQCEGLVPSMLTGGIWRGTESGVLERGLARCSQRGLVEGPGLDIVSSRCHCYDISL